MSFAEVFTKYFKVYDIVHRTNGQRLGVYKLRREVSPDLTMSEMLEIMDKLGIKDNPNGYLMLHTDELDTEEEPIVSMAFVTVASETDNCYVNPCADTVVSYYIMSQKFVESNGKRRNNRIPKPENLKEYYQRWVERMVQSYKYATLNDNPEELIIRTCFSVNKYITKFIIPEHKVVIINSNSGKVTDAKFDGDGTFSIEEGIAIAWARMTNQPIPKFPEEFVTLSELKYGDRFRAPFDGSIVYTFIAKDSDSDDYIVKRKGASSSALIVSNGDILGGHKQFVKLRPAKVKR